MIREVEQPLEQGKRILRGRLVPTYQQEVDNQNEIKGKLELLMGKIEASKKK